MERDLKLVAGVECFDAFLIGVFRWERDLKRRSVLADLALADEACSDGTRPETKPRFRHRSCSLMRCVPMERDLKPAVQPVNGCD